MAGRCLCGSGLRGPPLRDKLLVLSSYDGYIVVKGISWGRYDCMVISPGDGMTEKKTNWDDIPSLEGLEVDWEFEPENPLGKRAWVRIVNQELFQLLGVKKIPVRVISKNSDDKGYLIDLSQSGIAVLLENNLPENRQVKVGFFLGEQKIVSRAVVRNVREEMGRFRTGMEFVELANSSETFIKSLISSQVYRP